MGIINHVIRHFARHHPSTGAKHSAPMASQLEQFSTLIALQEGRQLIEARIPHYSYSLQTMIVGIDFFSQQLSLDEFSPQLADPKTLVGQTITLRHQRGHEMLSIEATIVSWEEKEHLYLLSLPEKIEYRPRRRSPRLTMADHGLLQAKLYPSYGAPWYATVKNISENGMRITVTGDLRSSLHHDSVLPRAQILINEGLTVECRCRIKAFSYSSRPFRHTEISVVFEGLAKDGLLNLQHFIHQLSLSMDAA